MTSEELDDTVFATSINTLLQAGKKIFFRSRLSGELHEVKGLSKSYIDRPFPKYSGKALNVDLKQGVGFTLAPDELDDWDITKVGDHYVLHKDPLGKVVEEVQTPLIYDILHDACRQAEEDPNTQYPNIHIKGAAHITIKKGSFLQKSFIGYVTSVGILKTGFFEKTPAVILYVSPDTPVFNQAETSKVMIPVNKIDEVLTIINTPAGIVVKNA